MNGILVKDSKSLEAVVTIDIPIQDYYIDCKTYHRIYGLLKTVKIAAGKVYLVRV